MIHSIQNLQNQTDFMTTYFLSLTTIFITPVFNFFIDFMGIYLAALQVTSDNHETCILI